MNPDTPELLQFLQRLYQFQTVGALSETICTHLPDLIGGENAIVCRHDGEQRVITAVVAKHAFSRANLMPHINESGIMAQHPFWESIFHPQQPVRALSDLVSREAWHKNPLYAEVFAPDGIEDQINTEVVGDPQRFTTVNVLRGKRGFFDKEHALMKLLRPHLAQAFINAALAERAGLLSSSSEQNELIPVDMHGALVKDSAYLSRGVPEPVLAWVKIQVQRFNEGWLVTTLEPYRYEDGAHTAIYALARDMEHGRYLLSVRHLTWRTSATRLTPREAEIMAWVAAGKSNEDIGAILETSINTIKTHLKRSFIKLGVENRTAAAAAWRDRNGHPKE